MLTGDPSNQPTDAPFQPEPDPHPETWRPLSTGPISAAGKTVSSMNRLTHGCRSLKTILRYEDPAAYAALIEGWMKHYDPQDTVERGLVEEAANAKWILMRNQRWLDDVEFQMNMNAYLWTESQQHQHTLHLRYKTSAERSYFRHFKELESYFARRDRKADRDRRETAQAKTSTQARPNDAGVYVDVEPPGEPALLKPELLAEVIHSEAESPHHHQTCLPIGVKEPGTEAA